MIGKKWTNSCGATWEVVALYKPGRYTVKSVIAGTIRVGEMNAGSIRAAIRGAEKGKNNERTER